MNRHMGFVCVCGGGGGAARQLHEYKILVVTSSSRPNHSDHTSG